MIIYPAIDLKAGRCVRLYQGQFDQITQYHHDPAVVAQSYAKEGAEWIHVVDLDGAQHSQSQQFDLICQLAKIKKLRIQTGGGIRTHDQISQLLQNGIARVVIGSLAVNQPTLVKNWLKEFGSDRIILALDVHCTHDQPLLATHGWQQGTAISLWQLLEEYQNSELTHVICTDIGKDGTLQGPNLSLYQECQLRYPTLQWQASGGIGQLSDIIALKHLSLSGVIIGKALYENKINLRELQLAAKEDHSC